jgi:hypothetical protein
VGETNGKPVLMSGIRPTPQQARAIQGHLASLRSRLVSGPQDRQAVAVELAKLLAAFPAQEQSDMPANLRMEAYFEALHGVPAWAIGEARARVLRGETALDMRFAPTPPQLAAVAKTLLEPHRRDLARLEIIARAAGEDAEPTDDEKARVTSKFDALRKEMRPRDFPL